ncbi:4'-phosphopantetheinyl transferase family protein [Pedobacter mendelii]|uniref:4'-phosphopantetheinyl transferase domain-containing protein n=1 Tax=Pedobacter mendelii TaxID=1908240 RepID=A0ABQ2BB55_9SPHI|nr:4'-phosphopantetheinyl transferase superfamily protein [Pedobacter mendelii]GGI22041.1 hypothetical protein GCM10008119_00660 [Pedobacter mendelii]
MLGNDIVDLNLARVQSNWRRNGYLEKIFTQEEQLLINSATNPDLIVWLLWSMKESAYKIHNRKTGIRNFAPKSFQCKLLYIDTKKSFGFVKRNELLFLTKSEINSTFIHTIATSEDLIFKNLIVKRVYNQSNYSNIFNLSKRFYLAHNEASLPEITNLKTKTKHITSISHHGEYLRIVFNKKSKTE